MSYKKRPFGSSQTQYRICLLIKTRVLSATLTQSCLGLSHKKNLTKIKGYYSIRYKRYFHIMDTIMNFSFLLTPSDLLNRIADRAKKKRLSLNLAQHTLSDRSGVSYGVIKKFERTGKISLESLLKLALVLDSLNEFDSLFSPKAPESYITLNQLLKQKTRKRGRK